MRIIGIYKITCIRNWKVYIGSSINVQNRFRQHKRHLRLGSHSNKHLQSAWTVHGEAAFRFDVVIEMPSATAEELIEAEVAMIKNMDSVNRERGFNYAAAGCPIATDIGNRSKRYIVTRPDGESFEVFNLSSFARSNGISIDSLWKSVRNDITPRTGWRARPADMTEEEWLALRKRGTKPGARVQFEYTFTTPTGDKIVTQDFKGFCASHHLSNGTMHGVVVRDRGRTHHRGFACERRAVSRR